MILAKGYRGKNFALQNFLVDLLNKNEIDQLLYIVPTNRKARSLRKELISKSPEKILSKFYVETLTTAAQKIFQPEAEKLLMNETTSIVLLRQCFREIELSYFKNYSHSIPHGTLVKLHYVISEYKRNGISPELLRREAEALPGIEKNKAEDIASLFEKYNSKLKLLNLFELGDVYFEALRLSKSKFADNLLRSFGGLKYMLVEGFTELTNPEVELINKIASAGKLISLIHLDSNSGNANLFSSVFEMSSKLKEKNFIEMPSENDEGTKFSSELGGKLFNPSIQTKTKTDKILLIETPTRQAEVKIIAAEIKTLLTEHSVQPHKICVAANLISAYSGLIRDRFSVSGIPFNLTDRYSLNTFQSVVSFINFLEIAENNFYYKNINRYLSSSLNEKEKSLFLDFQIVAARAKVTAGLNSWRDALNLLIQENDSAFESRSRSSSNSAERVLKFITTINEKLKPFKQKLSPSKFLSQFEKLIQESQIAKGVLQVDSSDAELHTKAIIAFIDTVRELMSLLEIEYSKSETFGLGFYLGTIKTAIQSARFNVKERSNYGVLVTSVEEIRGLNFDYLFLCGLCDGDFPTRYAPEIFVQSKFIRGEERHLKEEQLLFYQALKTAEEKIYLSCPAGEDNKEFSESFFVKEIKKQFDVERIDPMKHKNKIFSKAELLTLLGRRGEFLADVKTDDEYFDNLIKRIPEDIKIDQLRSGLHKSESIYNGFIFSEGTAAEGNFFNEHSVFSITQLESYAKCPYKYFLERVVRATVIEEPADEIQPMEIGQLLHRILFDFYSTYLKEGKRIFNCSDKDFLYFQNLIFGIADELIAALNFNSSLSFFEIEKITGINGRKENSVLYKFLEGERREEKFSPEFLEITFGLLKDERSQKQLVDFQIDGIKLRGQIDRIDLAKENKIFKVIDYKSGKGIPTKDELANGLSLQIPVYVSAARELIEKRFGEEFFADLPVIFSLKYDHKSFGQKEISIYDKRQLSKIDDANALDDVTRELENIAAEKIKLFVSEIQKGRFPLSLLPNRAEKVCKYCNFSSICRVTESALPE